MFAVTNSNNFDILNICAYTAGGCVTIILIIYSVPQRLTMPLSLTNE